MAVLTAIARAYHGISAPLPAGDVPAVSLDYGVLPYYALRTALRMFAALAASFLFTFTYATLAAKSRRAEMVLIPMLDILQSVPILGFLSFTVTFFLGLFPGNVLGAECAAIFAIFTSQAWNMAFSFYQSLRTVPRDLDEVARGFRLTGWQKFWQLEAPFAVPGLIWNTMMSMSGGWFFVVASEAITVGDTTITLPGVGSYIAAANNAGTLGRDRRRGGDDGRRHPALRPVAVPADHRLGGQVPRRAVGRPGGRALLGARPAAAHLLDPPRRLRPVFAALRAAGLLAPAACRSCFPATDARLRRRPRAPSTSSGSSSSPPSRVWALWSGRRLCRDRTLLARRRPGDAADLLHAAARRRADGAGDASFWVPISVWIGLRPRWAEAVQPIAQFLAAFPVNLLFGAAVSLVLVVPSQPRHLAQRPDRLRHAMVHRVQHDRRRGGVSQRPARGGGEFPRPRLGLVAAGDPARRRALLPHRRDHRLGRLVERLDRRRIRQVEGPDGRRARRRRLYRRGDRQGRLPQDRARRRR